MSFHHSPKIVTDGLVLCLDTADKNSYPGSGTTWNDLSGNGKTATMYGTVPFITDIVQCFDFATATGTYSGTSTLGFTFTSNMVQQTGDFTLSCWIKNPNSSSGQVGLFSNAGGGNGYRFGVGLNGIYYLIGPTYREGGIAFTSSLSSTLWYNVVAVYSRSTAQVLCYLNGVYQNAASIPASQTEFSNTTPGIVRSPCCGIYTGKLAMFSVHNTGLSAADVAQNFNAHKSRFGI